MRARTPLTGKLKGLGEWHTPCKQPALLPLGLRPVSVCREGVTIEVEVSVEAVPRSARQQSLSSALSGHSLSGDSLGATSDRGSSVGVPVE